MTNNYCQIQAAFRQIWGYDDFRPPQGEIIHSLLAKQDALIVMPTGGGKSICFQLPALLQTGLTLVISPLVALMENQVRELHQRHLSAALLHSELPKYERQKTLQGIAKQQLRLLYLSPETLFSKPVWELLISPQIKINGLILDEAHCLVQWGDTFRPAYRRLGTVRPSLLKYKPSGTKIAIAAFTATADLHSQKTIRKVLQLRQPATFLLSPYRNNLRLSVEIVWTPRGRKQKMLNFIRTKDKQAGLVYVRSRQESEELSLWFNNFGYTSAAYHGGLAASKRRQIEGYWLLGKIQFVVCTSAFGMGINKPNCRWIVHFQAPQLLSEYLQEVGRGGRDGKRADALTLISEPTGWLNPEDKQRNQFFNQQLQKQYQKAQQLASKIPAQGEITQISKQFHGADISLALLHSAGKLEWLDPFNYRQQEHKKSSFDWQKSIHQHRFLNAQMHQYLRTKTCRWQFLLSAFGFKDEAKGLQCGHCDNCLKH